MKDVPASVCDKKSRLALLILSTTFYDLSLSCNLFSKAKIADFAPAGTNASKTVGNQRVKDQKIILLERLDYRYL